MDERWLGILQLMETILDYITALASVGSLIIVGLGYSLARKWKDQLVEKSSLDEYYRYRESLYNELEELRTICGLIACNSVKYKEMPDVRISLDQAWRMIPEGHGISFHGFEFNEILHVFFSRLYNNRNELKSCISSIRSKLVFLDNESFNSLFENVTNEIGDMQWESGRYLRVGMVGFEHLDLILEVLGGERGHFHDYKLAEWEKKGCENWFKSFFGEKYDKQPVYNSIVANIETLQKAIINYPKDRLNSK